MTLAQAVQIVEIKAGHIERMAREDTSPVGRSRTARHAADAEAMRIVVAAVKGMPA